MDRPPVLSPGSLSRVRGELSEERVEQALNGPMPWWFLRSRRATREEDKLGGFDFVVYTRDVGRILLQVKSSRAGAFKWDAATRRRGRLYRIHLVIARPDMDPAVVLGRVLAACVVAREEAFAARCVADHWSLYPHLRMEAA